MPAAAYASSPDAVNNLENQLKLSLRPVQPNPEFAGHLHSRLTTPVLMTLERRENAALGLLVVAFALLSGLLLVWLVRHLRT